MLRDDLLNLLNKHRQEAVITCEESCVCWELERIIYEFDQEEQGNQIFHSMKEIKDRYFPNTPLEDLEGHKKEKIIIVIPR